MLELAAYTINTDLESFFRSSLFKKLSSQKMKRVLCNIFNNLGLLES